MSLDLPIEESINIIFQSYLSRVNTSLPGVIVKYKNKQRADIQPLFKLAYIDPDGKKQLIDPPILTDVPVILPVFGKAFIKFPIQKGDRVLLLINQRSLDTYLATDGTKTVDPKDTRKHNLTDAVAIYGIPTDNNSIETDEKNLIIGFTDDKTEIIIDPDRKVILNNTDRLEVGEVGASQALAIAKKTNEMVKEVQDAFNSFLTNSYIPHFHITPVGPSVPTVPPPVPPVYTKGPSDSERVFTNDSVI